MNESVANRIRDAWYFDVLAYMDMLDRQFECPLI